MKKRILTKIILIVLGVIATVVLLEAGLRIAGFFYTKFYPSSNTFKRKIDGSPVILCVGDSFTAGMGASPGKDYPSQLGNILQKNSEDKNILIINKGVIAQNTYELLNELPDYISLTKPDVVIVLTGMNNSWKFYGYSESLRQFSFYELTRKFKVCNLISLLFLRTKLMLSRHSFRENSGKAMTFIFEKEKNHKAKVDRNILSAIIDKFAGIKILDIKDCFASKSSFKNNSLDYRYYENLADDYFRKGEYELSLKCLHEALKLNPEIAEIYSKIGRIYLWHIINYDKAIAVFNAGILIDKNLYANYNGLAQIYYKRGEYKKSLEFIMRGSEKYKKISQVPSVLKELYITCYNDAQMKALFDECMNENIFLAKYLKILKKQIAGKKIFDDWIERDLEEIIKICQDRNIRVLFQTYPNKGFGVNEIIESVARKHSIALVDNYKVFNKLHSETEKYGACFAKDGHCSNLGYGIMAENIYNVLKSYYVLEDLKN